MQPLILPVETDENIRIHAYRDGRGIRACFSEGGFISIGLFRMAYKKVPDGQSACSGPVNILIGVDAKGAVTMEVEIRLNDKTVSRKLDPDVCDELYERLMTAEFLLTTMYTVRRAEIASVEAEAGPESPAPGQDDLQRSAAPHQRYGC